MEEWYKNLLVMFLAFFDATAEQIRRAIKERKNEK